MSEATAGKRELIDSVWVPEAPGHPGVYANLTDRNRGKLASGFAVSTMDVHSARQFRTHAECLEWCRANPHPAFVPVGHAFLPPLAAVIADDKEG